MQKLHISSIDLDITQHCNLSCPYCYLGQGTIRNKGTMSRETMEACLEMCKLYGAKPGPNRKHSVHFTFYGGEPLMAFPAVKEFTLLAEERLPGAELSIVSNGTIGTPEIVDFCTQHKLQIQRSIDGTPEAQEISRKGSSEKYAEQTKLWKDYNATRRMTVFRENAHLISESLTYFMECGFRPGGTTMPSFYEDWTEEEYAELVRQFWICAKMCVDSAKRGDPWYFFFFTREAAHRFSNKRNAMGCGAGRSLWTLTWDGYLYICHRFSQENRPTDLTDPNDSPFCFGHVNDIVAGTARGLGPQVFESLQKIDRNEFHEECDNCIAQYSCDGGCYHTNFKLEGDMYKPAKRYCRLQREVSKIVTWMDAELRPIDPFWWVKNNSRASEYVKRFKNMGLWAGQERVQTLKQRWNTAGREVTLPALKAHIERLKRQEAAIQLKIFSGQGQNCQKQQIPMTLKGWQGRHNADDYYLKGIDTPVNQVRNSSRGNSGGQSGGQSRQLPTPRKECVLHIDSEQLTGPHKLPTLEIVPPPCRKAVQPTDEPPTC